MLSQRILWQPVPISGGMRQRRAFASADRGEISSARKPAGQRQVDLAVALGDRYDQTMIFHVESGHSALLLVGAVKAARKLGVSLDLVRLTDDPTASAELSMAEITPEIRQLPGARPVLVRRLQTAAGSGTLDLYEEVKAYAYFRHEWFSRHGLVADRCSVISVTGESMELTLPEESVILVDHKRKRSLKGRIPVVRKSDGLVVKGAGKGDSGNWLPASDHPAWASEPRSEAEVIGEVRSMAREL